MFYFDFDGTLVDVWQRYYQIFKDASGISGMSLEEYIRIKKEFPRDADVARAFGRTLPEDYWTKKRSMLENPAYLAHDRLIVPAEQICEFFQNNPCRILTNRRDPVAFSGQLTALGLESLLDACVVLNPDDKKTKAQFLRENHPVEQIVLVGDAEAEAQAAEIDTVKVFLVRTGLRDPQWIPGVENCYIIESISDFMDADKESV